MPSQIAPEGHRKKKRRGKKKQKKRVVVPARSRTVDLALFRHASTSLDKSTLGETTLRALTTELRGLVAFVNILWMAVVYKVGVLVADMWESRLL